MTDQSTGLIRPHLLASTDRICRVDRLIATGRRDRASLSTISANFVSCGAASTRRRRRRTSVASCCCKPFRYQRSHTFWAEQFHAQLWPDTPQDYRE